MAGPTSAAAPARPRGPVARAIKWTFRRYFEARQAFDEVLAQACAEAAPHQPETATALPAPVAGGSDAEPAASHRRAAPVEAERPSPGHEAGDDAIRVSWITPEGIDRCPVEQLEALLRREDGYVWVDVPVFDASAERILADVFRFHPLAIRDCREPGHVPKVHAYDDHLLIELHAPVLDRDGQVQRRELNQFIGRRYLVTVHEQLGTVPRQPEPLETAAVLARIEAGRTHPVTPAELSYAIVTRLAVRMEAMVAELASAVAALAGAVAAQDRQVLRGGRRSSEAAVDEMFALRHALLGVETIADQNHVAYARMGALASRYVSAELRPYLEDLDDQFSRIRRLCRGQKELLQGVMEFSRTRTSAKMDLAMSRLALLSAVALPVSVISSIYGMNVFVFSQTRLDILALTLGLMTLMALGMFRWAQHQGWW